MHPRYAVYFAPAADSLLWRAGCSWLGRDPASRICLPQPEVTGIAAEGVHAITASPRQYGLHATLKPPFHLADGLSADHLIDAIKTLTATSRPFTLPPLEVGVLSDFIALRTQWSSSELQSLADRCVVELDPFRRPASQQELARRRVHPLSPAQERFLQHYGYPYVMDEWRFHITLTDRVFGAERDLLCDWLANYLEPALLTPMCCEDLCLFIQPRSDAPFDLAHRFPLSAR
jgi:putative phosphonate metabolism protein